jgi:hypothetical protein
MFARHPASILGTMVAHHFIVATMSRRAPGEDEVTDKAGPRATAHGAVPRTAVAHLPRHRIASYVGGETQRKKREWMKLGRSSPFGGDTSGQGARTKETPSNLTVQVRTRPYGLSPCPISLHKCYETVSAIACWALALSPWFDCLG